MKAMRYYGPGDIRLDNIPEPTVGAGQVKIKVSPVTIAHIRIKPAVKVAW